MTASDDWNIIVGLNIRRLRAAAAFSREELAARAEVDWTYLGAIERGKRNPTVALLARLAAALSVSPSELFVRHRLETDAAPRGGPRAHNGHCGDTSGLEIA